MVMRRKERGWERGELERSKFYEKSRHNINGLAFLLIAKTFIRVCLS